MALVTPLRVIVTELNTAAGISGRAAIVTLTGLPGTASAVPFARNSTVIAPPLHPRAENA
jgi:hypothetical protein